MADDRPEDAGPSPDLGRIKRAPPTIDLEATDVTGETQAAGADSAEPKADGATSVPPRSDGMVKSAVVSAISGAIAATLVIGAAWYVGWPAQTPPEVPAPQVNTAAIDALSARIASVEAKAAKPSAVAPDPVVASRADALEKSLAALRGELETTRVQSEKLATAVNDAKSAPSEVPAPPPLPDLSPINERLSQIERSVSAQKVEAAKANAKPADDVQLRRMVAASLLDVSLRHGEPYAAALAAAKPLATNPEALKALEPFAATGVPNPNMLSRELLALVPKLSPPVPETATIGSGIVDRLQAGASKLVRIQRTDVAGSDRGAIVARVTAAALRNDIVEARRELNTLDPADRAAAQPWVDKVNARDAALAASRQFAADAMAALAKPTP